MSSSKSLLQITDWKEVNKLLNEPKIELIDYFVTKYDQSYEFGDNMDYLRYYDPLAMLNFAPYEELKPNPIKESYNFLINYFEARGKPQDAIQIITYASILNIIMNTPFEINKDKRKWHLTARYLENRIYLYSEDIIEDERENEFNLFLKKDTFIRKPQHYHRRIISNMDNHYFEVYNLNLSDNNVIYLADNPGIMEENTIKNFDELKSANHGICDVYLKDEISQDIINYNPITWSKAELIKAKHCIVGVYNKEKDILEDIATFNADIFNDKLKYENLWSPIGAWNFLDLFLTFVNIEFMRFKDNYKHKILLEFKSYSDDKPYVICEPYREVTYNFGETYKSALSSDNIKL